MCVLYSTHSAECLQNVFSVQNNSVAKERERHRQTDTHTHIHTHTHTHTQRERERNTNTHTYTHTYTHGSQGAPSAPWSADGDRDHSGGRDGGEDSPYLTFSASDVAMVAGGHG